MEQDNMNKPQSSTEFASNSKGYVTFSVKVYNESPDEAYRIARDLSDNARAYTRQINGE